MTAQTPGDRWYYAHDRKKVGPVSLAHLGQLLADGVLKPDDKVLQEGAPKWRPVAEVVAPSSGPEKGGVWKWPLAACIVAGLLAVVGGGLTAAFRAPGPPAGPGQRAEADPPAGEDRWPGPAAVTERGGPVEKPSPPSERPATTPPPGKGKAQEVVSDATPPPTATPRTKLTVLLQLGHSNYLRHVAYSPDGKFIVTCSADHTARLWETATGRELRSFPHASSVNSADFSPDGKTLLTTAAGKVAYLWDVASGKVVRKLEGHRHLVERAVFSPDGEKALTMCRSDRTTRLWDLATGQTLRVFKADTAAFSPDGRQVLADGGANVPGQLWDIATGRVVHPFRSLASTNLFAHVAFSPDGKKVFAGQGVWDVATRRLLAEMPFTRGRPVDSLSFSPDGKYLVTGGADRIARLWDVNTGKEVRSFKAHGSDNFGGPRTMSHRLTAAFSPDGKHIVTASQVVFGRMSDHVAQLWDVETGREVRAFRGVIQAVSATDLSPAGDCILTAGADGSARLWDLATGRLVRILMGHTEPINAAMFSPDGKHVLTGGGDPVSPDTRRFGRTSDGKWWQISNWPPRPNSDNTARLWDAATGEEVRAFRGHTLYLRRVAFSPDGKQVLTAGTDRITRLWDAATAKPLRTLDGHINPVNYLVFSPDGKHVLTGTEDPTHHIDDTARLWDAATGNQVRVIQAGRQGSGAVAFFPDGKQLIAGGKVWETATGKQASTFPHLTRVPMPSAFSSDRRKWLTGNHQGQIVLTDIASGKVLASFRGHTAAVRSLSLSANGRHVVSSSADGTVRVWDAATGRERCRLLGFVDGSWAAITPDNYYMASRGNLEGVSFRLGDRLFAFDQFDLRFNRPDKVLESIGLAPREVIAAYRQAYLKRLKRQGFTEDMLADDYHLPELTAAVVPRPSTRERKLKLKVKASDSRFLLDRLHVDVNGVPLRGTGGIDLRKHAGKTWEQEVEVELSSGPNKVQVSVLNEKGAESLKQTISIQCDAPPSKPTLFVVAVGVSDYADAKFKLTYADKDARDLAAHFKANSDRYADVKVLSVLNRDATRENVLMARDFLRPAGVDDQVVVFFAGHGLLDAKLDYYFATADIDFADPAKRGLPYDAIEGLLDGTRARRKLLLMDTCHSGELDRDDTDALKPEKVPEGEVKARSFRGGLTRLPSRVGLGNSFQLMQELFADLRRGTGAAVIASAGGAEFALESERWKNGVFTHALLRGLRGEADQNKDGRVQVSELRNFVEPVVRRLTGGRQSPTSRRENITNDFFVD